MFKEESQTNAKQENSGKAELAKNLLSFEDGIVKLGDKELPGIFAGLSVQDEVKTDEAKSDGQSGKKKTPLGFEDANITVDLILLTDDESDCYAKLLELDQLFKGVTDKAAPKILTVVNRHMRARRVNQVIFAQLNSQENNQDDSILAHLKFTEHTPPVVTAERRVVAAGLDTVKAKNQSKFTPPSIKLLGGAMKGLGWLSEQAEKAQQPIDVDVK